MVDLAEVIPGGRRKVRSITIPKLAGNWRLSDA